MNTQRNILLIKKFDNKPSSVKLSNFMYVHKKDRNNERTS